MIELSSTGIMVAFAAGIVSFLSPCVLPLVPGYVSFIAGQPAPEQSRSAPTIVRMHSIALSACFVAGFSTIFVLLGASATVFGQLLRAYSYELNIIGGAIVIGFGLLTLGAIRPAWFQRDMRFHATLSGGRPVGAYMLGMAFAFGWTPCIGPILGAILAVSATSTTVSSGIVLLAVYSLGLGVPFILAAVFTDALAARIRSLGFVGRTLKVVAGVVMIVMGVAMITGHLTTFAFWLLEMFPALSSIG